MRIALPIMLQTGITNFVSMLDNIMVGRIGTDPMTGVSIVNSLLFVWNLCVFGGLSGIGIFTAQYCGKGDDEGIRRTFRLQIVLSAILVSAGLLLFFTHGEDLINLYLHEDGGGGSAYETMKAALRRLFSCPRRRSAAAFRPTAAAWRANLRNILIFSSFPLDNGAPAWYHFKYENHSQF